MANPKNFYTLLFTQSSLYMNESLESQIATLVNTSFHEIPNFTTTPRFANPSDISRELGDEGLIAIAFDPVPGADRDRPVACISAKKDALPSILIGSGADEDEAVDGKGPHFKIYGVATLASPNGYRKKGLIPLCLRALRDALPQDSVVWLETAEAANGPYWRKNGFEIVRKEMRPAGFWGAEKEFEWVALRAR
ncbi:hypothetical protein FKW77_007672 [Venturia effusa]|uniref:N-acetyltransferase domain-containing protein n=1 Tax=Venturia effusa TaxID=50376 RepID=A0A517LJ71_9PEZI|nr:hypothetical protein FKW77_007672 [Venturia effusa]